MPSQTPLNLWSENTEGLCPDCLRSLPARLFVDSGRVWLESECPAHGSARALIASDAEEYLRLRQYVAPRVSGGCCANDATPCESGPPVCVLLLEITSACNLRCPTCYADARGHDFMSVEEARRRLDAFFRRQSRLDLLMISGGEPTIHSEFTSILDLALEYPIDRVLINTNGLRIVQDPGLLQAIAARRKRVELYLSYASFRAEVHERLYGRDLREEKRSAVEMAGEAGLFVTLVPTVERGVNVDEIGDLYQFALSMDNVSGITFQPVMSAGRYEHGYSPEQRLTMTDVLGEIERQTDGALRADDFVGLPCSHPDCCSLTYGLLDDARTTIIPLPRHLDVSRYLDLFADRISFAGLLSGAARRVWSDTVHFRGGRALRDLSTLFLHSGIREVYALRRDPEAVGRRIFRVVVKPFMDAHTYDVSRIRQCCTMVLAENGEPVSFCEYNVFHRRKPRRADIPLTLRA